MLPVHKYWGMLGCVGVEASNLIPPVGFAFRATHPLERSTGTSAVRFGNIRAATSEERNVNLQQLFGFAQQRQSLTYESVQKSISNFYRSFDFFVTTLMPLRLKDDEFDQGLIRMDVSDARETAVTPTHWR
jgi:hypothetical protein